MKRQWRIGISIAICSLTGCVDKGPTARPTLIAAARRLSADGYAFKASIGGPIQPFRIEGQVASDGLTHVLIMQSDQVTEAFVNGDKYFVKKERGWIRLNAAD